MLPADEAGGVDDQDTALLLDVALHATLAAAAQEGAEGAGGEREGDDPAALELCGAVRGVGGVGEDGTGKAGGLTEAGDEVGGAVANDIELGAGSADSVLIVVQLHDVIAAVKSAELADENEDGGPLTPEGAEWDVATVLVKQGHER